MVTPASSASATTTSNQFEAEADGSASSLIASATKYTQAMTWRQMTTSAGRIDGRASRKADPFRSVVIFALRMWLYAAAYGLLLQGSPSREPGARRVKCRS